MQLPNFLKKLNGTNNMSFQALLTTRHLVPDSHGDVIAQDGERCREIVEDRRKATKCVTDAFVYLLVDDLVSTQSNWHNFKYHDSGTGVVAEAASDTTLGTACGEARDTGSQTEGATGNIYKSVATHTYAGSFAITEHGLFNASTSGTLMDRSKFSAVNVTSGEKIEFTYQLTISSGG